MESKIEEVLALIAVERTYQEKKFPGQTYGNANQALDDKDYLSVLAEEVGEVSRNINDKVSVNDDLTHVVEVIQTAAVAVRWAESILHRSGLTYEAVLEKMGR